MQIVNNDTNLSMVKKQKINKIKKIFAISTEPVACVLIAMKLLPCVEVQFIQSNVGLTI